MTEQQIIKYSGGNDQMFWRCSADDYPADACLVVPDTHYAVLIKDGVYMETLNAGKHQIFDTVNGLFKTKKDRSVASVDVVFLSKTARLKVLWGTRNQFHLRDFETDVPVSVGASGEFEVQISNPKKFYLSLVGAEQKYCADMLQERLMGRMISEMEPQIAAAMHNLKLSYDRILEHKQPIAEQIYPVLQDMFEKDYGLKLYSFVISAILISKDDLLEIKNKRTCTTNATACQQLVDQTPHGFYSTSGKQTESGKKVCTSCQHQNEIQAKFCLHCGKKL